MKVIYLFSWGGSFKICRIRGGGCLEFRQNFCLHPGKRRTKTLQFLSARRQEKKKNPCNFYLQFLSARRQEKNINPCNFYLQFLSARRQENNKKPLQFLFAISVCTQAREEQKTLAISICNFCLHPGKGRIKTLAIFVLERNLCNLKSEQKCLILGEMFL